MLRIIIFYILVAYGFFFFGQAAIVEQVSQQCSVVIIVVSMFSSLLSSGNGTELWEKVECFTLPFTVHLVAQVQYAYFYSIILEDSNISLSLRACQKSHCNHTTNRLLFKVAAPLHLIKSFISKHDKFVPLFLQFTSIFIIFRFMINTLLASNEFEKKTKLKNRCEDQECH